MAGRTKIALLLVLAGLALVLVACGGDDGDPRSTAPSPQQSGTASDGAEVESEVAPSPEEPPSGSRRSGNEPSSGGGGSESSFDGSGDAGNAASGGSSQKGEGGFSSRSRPFRTPGGDNSIQTFGAEASDAERQAASTVLESYMRVRADGDHAAECRYLAKAVIDPLEQMVQSAPGAKGKACAAALETLLSKAPPAASVNTMTGPIDSLRVEGERGFAMYRGTDATYFVPMVVEGGEWKVGGIAPTQFP